MADYELLIDNRSAILYALGIGFQKDPMNAKDYSFTYENADNFQTFPTQAVTLTKGMQALLEIPGVPEYNMMMLLHGEEKVEFYSPIAVDSTVIITESVEDIQDKGGKSTVLVILREIKDKDSGELKAKVYTTVFIRGLAGSGNKGTFKNYIPNAPKTAPHKSSEEKTDAS